MATLLDKFKKSVIGSQTDFYDYISRIDASGDFQRVKNFEVILNSWNNILLTPKRTYDHDPEYGSELYKYVFEPLDIQTQESIKAEIKDSLNTYTDRVSIESINVKFLSNNKGFSVDIVAKYNGILGNLSFIVDENLYFNFNS